MSDSVKEQLSACLDGELAEAELDLLLKRVGRDSELREAIGRYALLSEALRGDKPAAASPSFAGGVMAAIENDSIAARSRLSLSPSIVRRLRPVAGFAIAAGVAAVAVLSVQRAGMAPAIVADTEIAAPAQTLAAADQEPSYTVPTNTSTSAFVPATRLTNYVVAHSEYSSPLGRRTVLSGVLSEGDFVADSTEDEDDVEPVVETQVTHP
ncbi:MAG: sigma-E factor negative regulatory protein [Steroidobacter sp.]